MPTKLSDKAKKFAEQITNTQFEGPKIAIDKVPAVKMPHEYLPVATLHIINTLNSRIDALEQRLQEAEREIRHSKKGKP